eukprot:6150533-Ditylum_brightwellii.AAC.1
MERSKLNKHVVCNKYNDVDNGVDNGDDSVEDGDDDDVDNSDDGADMHLTHLSQAADCCLIERSKLKSMLFAINIMMLMMVLTMVMMIVLKM